MSHEYTFSPGQKSPKVAKATSLNTLVTMLLDPPWAGVLRFDDFRKRAVAVNPPMSLEAETTQLTDADISAITAWYNFHGKKAGLEVVSQAVQLAARKNKFHPIVDYLAACKPGPEPLLDTLASRLFGCEPGIADEFLCKTLIGAVRRIRDPGCKLDTVLVLTGEQGLLKSTLVSELFGAEFTRSQMPDLANKDASAALRGFWAVELAELDRIVRTETSTVKEFLSRTSDDYRPPYGRLDQHFPRECVFIGTCNDEDFLRDPTGNRRFWPIRVKHIDLDYLRVNRDAIWGEAAALETAGAEHWLDAAGDQRAKEARGEHNVLDAWHDEISTYLHGRDLVTTEEIYRGAIGGETISFGQQQQMRIVNTLKRLGCKPQQVSRSGRRRREWLVPKPLASLPLRNTLSHSPACRCATCTP